MLTVNVGPGRWEIDGITWKRLREILKGASVREQQIIYGLAVKLHSYERTGMTPYMAEEIMNIAKQ